MKFKILERENKVIIEDIKNFNTKHIFEGGQCFRWNETEDLVYHGVAFGYPAKVWQEAEEVFISSDAPEELWRGYFDLDRDYEAASASFRGGEYLDEAKRFGRGIRILRQEPWEALCSFIISQCNNIPRIKGIVERLCACFGDAVSFEGREYHTFPAAERIARLSLEDLQPLRSGYRAEYILNAAKEICSGSIDLDRLAYTDWVSAEKALLSMKGIGKKVADCVLLFGLHHMEAFPPDFDPSALGENAGLAQQYIFYYARSGQPGQNMT